MSSLSIEGREIKAAILDLDGVVTDTATLHAKAWEKLFNEFLSKRQTETGQPQEKFSFAQDYSQSLDGKPRHDGIRSFLKSRGINLPFGHPREGANYETVTGLGLLKNKYFHELLERHGPTVFTGTVNVIKRWRAEGLQIGLVSSSRNCRAVLERAGIKDCFDVVVDGIDLERSGLKGKPEPDMFLEAARRMGVEPGEALVVEDALAGVEAGRRGGFALVVGFDSRGIGEKLRQKGADLVVPDLSYLLDSEVSAWTLIFKKWDPGKQGVREALCALGNGTFMLRGAFPETQADGTNYPGCYLAGTYDRAKSEIGGRTVEHEDLVNWPNPLQLNFKVDGGEWFGMNTVKILDFQQVLDVRAGTLSRKMDFEDQGGRRFCLSERRFVHMSETHFAGLQWSLRPQNWSGSITVRSGIDGTVINDNVARYRQLNRHHLQIGKLGSIRESGVFLEARSLQSEIKVAQAIRNDVSVDGKEGGALRTLLTNDHRISQEIAVECREGEEIRVDKIISIYSSRDRAISEPLVEAIQSVEKAGRFETLLASHERAWSEIWRRCDIEIPESYTQFVLRLHIFHLLQTASPWSLDSDAGIPARGWHGEAYRGHVFWDELFVLPFLNFRVPEVSRELLMYRYRRLTQAQRRAKDLGFEGAMFPWQSGSNGREECPSVHLNPKSQEWVPDRSSRQWHVGAAIAFNVWQYYQTTRDLQFISYYGAKMVFEIARFFASLVRFSSEKKRFEILDVVGPDEFHTGYPWREGKAIDNNAYTNIMVSWTLDHALRIYEMLSEKRRAELSAELSLTAKERCHWREVSESIFVPIQESGVISQFEHFERLKELDWPSYRKKYGDIQRLDRILDSENDSTNNYQVVKQADVIMLFYLFSTEELQEIFHRLGYCFEPRMIPQNIEYYSARSSHGSTLSRIVHAWVLARLDRPRAWQIFKEALRSDISDIQGGTTSEGVHLGAMGGTIDIIQRCFTGLELRDEVLWFNPILPDELPGIKFRLRYAGHWIHVDITHLRLKINLEQSWAGPVKIGYLTTIKEMSAGASCEFALVKRSALTVFRQVFDGKKHSPLHNEVR